MHAVSQHLITWAIGGFWGDFRIVIRKPLQALTLYRGEPPHGHAGGTHLSHKAGGLIRTYAKASTFTQRLMAEGHLSIDWNSYKWGTTARAILAGIKPLSA